MKKMISVFLAVLMLALPVASALPALAANDYLFSYTYSDIQMEKNSEEQRYHWIDKEGKDKYGSNIITKDRQGWGSQDLPVSDASRGISRANVIYLAQNEREGFQVYFYEKGAGRNLRIEVGEFVNAAGDVLPHEVFREEYFTPIGSQLVNPDGSALVLADALVPCDDIAEIRTTQNQNETFYIEVRSAKDQPAGVYYADVKLYDGDTALTPTWNTTRVAAVVWDFALPEQHYGTMMVGLYNSASNYGDCASFLRLSGVNVNGWGNSGAAGDGVTAEDREQLDRIVEGWQEFLLDHGIMTYELPRHLIDTDEKAAELAMADVRRKNFFIPLINADAYNGVYDAETLAKIGQYKNVIGDNEALLSKAAFYVKDEPDLATDAAELTGRMAAAQSAWPEVRRFVSYCKTNVAYDDAKALLDPAGNIVCLNNELLATNARYFNDYTENYAYRWRYPGDHYYGGVELWKYRKSTVGMLRRMLFWQQHAMNEEVFLYWNCAYYSGVNMWETHTLPAAGGIQTGNGNGILLYPGAPIGLSAETPVASLRLKQIASGIDDADYLALAEEFMSEEDYTAFLRSFLKNARNGDSASQIFSSETAAFPFNETNSMNKARVALGNALETAVGEHTFGDWHVIVTPDETHCGLAVRECADCGTQESKKIGLCDEGHHVYGDYTADDADTHTRVCEVCGVPETTTHTPVTVNGTAPSCAGDGCTDSVVCADCGYVFTAAQILPGGHKLGEWNEGEEAVCNKEGVKGHYTCSVCQKNFDADKNELESLVIEKDMNRHVGELTVENASAPTCTEPGYTGDSVCSACGNVKTCGTAIAPSGHVWGEGVMTKEPTCTGKGEKTFTCTVCEATRTEEIAALGHTAPDADGRCTRCGAEIVKKCPLCGETHQGFPGVLVGFFHKIIWFFKNLFQK